MRTTVDIADEIYADLKGRAARERTSVKALIERAVCRSLQEEQSVHDFGTTPPWPTIRAASGPPIMPVSNDFALFGLDEE